MDIYDFQKNQVLAECLCSSSSSVELQNGKRKEYEKFSFEDCPLIHCLKKSSCNEFVSITEVENERLKLEILTANF